MIRLVKRYVRFLLDNLSIKKTTKVSQNGIEFIVETRDKLGEEWNLISDYDYSEFQVFHKIDKNKIYNVYYFGSHQCVIPIKIHKIFLKKTKLFCFEAIRKNYLVGKQNIKLNNCEDKVELFNESISTINGFEYFDPISMNSYKTDKKLFSTKVKSLDLETAIKKNGEGNLLYFDIEGLEGKVIEKGINFLKTWKNNLFIEAHGIDFMERYNYSNVKLFNLLKNNGYEVYKLKKDYKTNIKKFEKIIQNEDVPEKRFYMYAHN